MKKDSQELENQLTGQQAADLDEALLDRLEAAADGTLTELTEEEVKFEAKLRAIQPQVLSPQLLASLEAKVEGLPAPSQVSVLPFPGTQRIEEEPTPARFSWVAAAAAVLLLGVMSAVWIPWQAPPTPRALPANPQLHLEAVSKIPFLRPCLRNSLAH